MITPKILTKRLRTVEPDAVVRQAPNGWQFRRNPAENWMPLANDAVYAASAIHNIVAAYLTVKK